MSHFGVLHWQQWQPPAFAPAKEQYSLIVMDTFKGQDNAEIRALCLKNDCKLVIVPHNLTDKLQPLEITINQKAKKFISHKFNTWSVDRVSEQLKPLHVYWIVDIYTYLKQHKESILNRLDKAGITEAVKSANEKFARIENPFAETRVNEM